MAHDRSTNQGFPLLQQGDEIDNWGDVVRTEAFVPLEERLMVVDTSVNRSNYTPYADLLYYETDTGAFYEGDGSAWLEAQIESRLSSVESKTTDSSIMQTVGENLGTGLTFDQEQNLINATASSGINRLNAAESFTEVNLSATLNQIEVVNGGLELPGPEAEAATWGSEYNTVTDTGKTGVIFEPDEDLSGVRVTTGPTLSSNHPVELREATTDTLETVTDVGPSQQIEFTTDLTAGVEYSVISPNGTSYVTTSIFDTAGTYPFGTSKVTITNGLVTNDFGDIGLIESLTPLYAGANSESATVAWTTDRDVYEWDRATYQESPDGETVDVYLAYSSDGSTWSRTNGGSPISRGYDLGADSNIQPEDDLRFEVELSRTDTLNNPRLESAYLSWTV